MWKSLLVLSVANPLRGVLKAPFWNYTIGSFSALYEDDTLIEYVRKNGTDYRITEHVKLRWTMRIQPSQDLEQEHIDNSVRINLSGGYNRGLWNREIGAILLVAADSISTVIPDQDLDLDEDMDHCSNCDALIMEDCQLDHCRWCGETDYEESVTSLEAEAGSPQ